jgi:TPR repeat protein
VCSLFRALFKICIFIKLMTSRQERRALARTPTPTDWRKQDADPESMTAAIGASGVESRAANGDAGALYSIACGRLLRVSEQTKLFTDEYGDGSLADREISEQAAHTANLAWEETRLAKSELERASKSGHVYATELLGDACRNGNDFAAAKECYTNAAAVGLPGAMFKLGRCLESGEGGLELDAPAAAEWYRKAAGSGHAGAACNLRFMRAVGRGVARSKRLEMVALRKAAENGDRDAAWTFVHAVHIDQPYAREVGLGFEKWFTREERERVDASLAKIDSNGGDMYCCNIGCDLIGLRKDFKVCPQCKFYRYCGIDCQAADWTTGGHARFCCTYAANFDQRS